MISRRPEGWGGRLAPKAVLLFCACAAAQSGPQIQPRQPPPAQADKEQSYLLLDELRAAIRNDDWAEAVRLANRLTATIYFKRRDAAQSSPDLELAHVELMAGRDAATRIPLLPRLARTAFAAHNYQKAARYANEALAASRQGSFWWTGDAIHQGNIVLGRLALLDDDVQAAEGYLLAAGKAPKTPALGSLGPNMGLAQELLWRGKPGAVIQYLEECRQFWVADRGKLAEWLALVRAGLKPNFGPNVDY